MTLTTIFRPVVSTAALTTVIGFSPLLTAIAQAETLNGAGATFPAPLYERYAREVRKKHPELKVNYQAIGSGGGIRQTIEGTVDFGASDAAMKDDQIAKVKNGVILVPTAGGAVSVVYNLPGVNRLRLSRKTLPDIFSGKITNWDDQQIKADNPGVNLPNQPIRFAVRADGSGTTFIFTNHLSSINPYFKGRIGANTAPKWTLPNVLKGKGNPGVAALVARTPGSIGYVEYDYATKNNLRSAEIQNRKGEFVAPSLAASNAALSTVTFPANYRVFVGDPSQGYPIVGLTWMMIYQKYSNPSKADAIKKWINWVLKDGQQFNDDLNYTKIPQDVVNRVLQTVNSTVK
ncbi:phosphate ABC transporter substrate-binding protein PstS [Cylindrospermopsis raciborskii S07]|uniref:phosphate ABC transporter substrate-binding protein PstS n=1 Tax=Cylindrospermopsis raciborskii TaxID=77022 RepID=UPI000C9EBB6E|nr:phosphate ABC transporter substrate-binding protein PstS [Cylindrospermopsis raciborskii]PNK02409.1 phosphate ABC transporter substrate-binding protein PstS [Cylindrospermopsis raciborskii S07]PNK05890.1 phosphate ABC transporter substrate-binding protein PstS [Cylindrospermopsis raciborskii S14]PNK07405.1 phosphate ABC transporter substrate-binding protein PstS [Cylindrospermopsis raciborskii S10]PNK17076.1 phosphate ABC transporter substrate-binding protein PstS [Cylindrospermopsis racibor